MIIVITEFNLPNHFIMKKIIHVLGWLLFCSNAVIAQTEKIGGAINSGALYVKFPDDTHYDVKEKQISSPEQPTNPVFLKLTKIGWWSRVHELSKEQLTAYRTIASQNLNKKLIDFNSEFYFHLYDTTKIEEAQAVLKEIKEIERVLTIPLFVNAIVPDFRPRQSYCQSLPSGINSDSARLVYGADGAGVKVCDIEYSFNKNHADLPLVTTVGQPFDPNVYPDHGTAVMGIIASKDDGVGTTGIAPACSLYFSPTYVGGVVDHGRAITSALPHLSAGDIILIEQQMFGPTNGYAPVEWYLPTYNAIQLAVGLGIIVVEAAGNGSQNLDGMAYRTGNGGHYPFLAANNSGAIIVGAGSVGSALGGSNPERTMMYFSNYGSRVDVQGNGERVTTTGYGDAYSAEGVNKHYTYTFSGTSSASPIVVGAIALLQSAYKNRYGIPLTTSQVIGLLKSTGKPQEAYSASAYHIGPLPDAYAAIKKAFVISKGSPAMEYMAGSSPIQAKMASSVSPNPTSGVFTIALREDENIVAINIINTSGSIVKNISPEKNSKSIQIDLRDQPSGLYMALINATKHTETVKIEVLK